MYDYYNNNRPWESYEDSIKNVVINNGVTRIGKSAFSHCSSLTSVTIPDSVTTISYGAFGYCSSLASITVDNNNKYYSNDEYGVLFNKDKTTLIQYPIGNTRINYTIPDSVITINYSAFYHCTNLTSVTIGNSVTTIGYDAFFWCNSLTSVTIPDSVTTIGDYAFYGCDRLKNVYYGGTEAQWNEISIDYYNDELYNATIHYNYHVHNYKAVATPVTCTQNGYTTCTCECGDIYVDNYVSATGHTPAGAVEKNYVAPTCTENGSKDIVVYCSVCDEEISRETVTIEATGHADNDGDGYCDTCNELLDPTVECNCNCHKSGISNFFFKFALFFQKLFGSNKTCACGVAHY